MDFESSEESVQQSGVVRNRTNGLNENENTDDEPVPKRAARRLTRMEPLEDSLLNSKMMKKTKEVSISRLTSDEIMNLNYNYIDVQLTRIITAKKEQKAFTYALRNGRNGGASKEIPFTRIFQCRVFSSTNNRELTKICLKET